MYFFPKTVTPLILAQAESTVRPAALLRHSTTQFVVVSLCCFSLRHDNMKFIAAFFFSLKPLVRSSNKKKSQTKKRSVKRYRAKCIKRQLMENIIKCSYPKMTSQTRVWPVKSMIRPDIVRWPAVILSPVATAAISPVFFSGFFFPLMTS